MAVEFNHNKTLYEELSKKDSPLDDQDYLVLKYSDYFVDNGTKKFRSKNLGEKFAAINSFFFDYLKEYHIPTAYVKSKNKSTLKFIKHDRLPFFVKIYNTIDKRTAKIFNKKENEYLNLPIFEFHHGEGKETLISESHLIAFDICSNEDIKLITRICSKVNAVLKSYFERRNLILAEVCCTFGKNDGKIYLVDDFTPRSIKVLPSNGDKAVDPYNLSSSAIVKKYTDQIYHITNA